MLVHFLNLVQMGFTPAAKIESLKIDSLCQSEEKGWDSNCPFVVDIEVENTPPKPGTPDPFSVTSPMERTWIVRS